MTTLCASIERSAWCKCSVNRTLLSARTASPRTWSRSVISACVTAPFRSMYQPKSSSNAESVYSSSASQVSAPDFMAAPFSPSNPTGRAMNYLPTTLHQVHRGTHHWQLSHVNVLSDYKKIEPEKVCKFLHKFRTNHIDTALIKGLHVGGWPTIFSELTCLLHPCVLRENIVKRSLCQLHLSKYMLFHC